MARLFSYACLGVLNWFSNIILLFRGWILLPVLYNWGGHLTLSCTLWLLNVVSWRLVDFDIQSLDNNSVLRIYRKRFEHAGAFQCVTENSEGIAVANFLIESESVKGKTT